MAAPETAPDGAARAEAQFQPTRALKSLINVCAYKCLINTQTFAHVRPAG
jgi:hypothetical protein